MGAAAPIQALLRVNPIQMLGCITRIDANGKCWAESDGHEWQVQRAASCLVAPQLDDEVLLYGPTPDTVFLIAIVKQARPGPTRIEAQGELEIVSVAGGITVDAAREVCLRSDGAIRNEAPRWHARADEANCTFKSMDYLGVDARVALGSANVAIRTCELVMERLSQFAHSVMRLTRDTEQVRAGHLDLQAQHTLRLHAEHSLLTGKRLVKVDADQIHMG